MAYSAGVELFLTTLDLCRPTNGKYIASAFSLKKDKRSIVPVLLRSLRLRCPACGQSSIVKGPFQIRHHCPTCRSLFKREEGFFVGAIMANVITTEFVILVACFVWLFVIGSTYEKALVALFITALIFPVAFYHHSWSFWLGFDYLVESLPKYEKKK